MELENMVQDDQDWIEEGRRHAARGRGVSPALRAAGVAAVLAACLLLGRSVRADEAPPPAQVSPPAAAAAAPAAPATDPVVAERGNVKLTASQVRDMIRFADPEQRHLLETNPSALLQAVRDRLIKLALADEALAHGWDKREDVAYRIEAARQDAIAGSWIAAQVAGDPNFPTDAQVQTAYDLNKAKLTVPREYNIAQIFIVIAPGASKQNEDDAQHKLADLRQQLLKQHADFAALAKRYSDEKASAANGGELGWVREDTLLPPVRAAVQGMAEGAISEPVRSQNGWHLIKLTGIKAPAQATLAEARDTLVKAMRQERMVEGQRNYLNNMLKQQSVEVNEIELSKFAPK
jgi:PPIC-type PPIASE domain